MRRSKICCLLAVLLCCLPLTACAPRARTEQAFLLNTVVRLTLWRADDRIFDDCFALIEEAEAALSRTDPDSELAALNANGGGQVSDGTAELISAALSIAAQTDGAFDPTIGRVSALWAFGAVTPSLPDANVLADALSAVDYRGVTVGADGQVAFALPGMQLDLGAIAKGEIADRLVALLRARGIEHAILNLGGNVAVLGGNPDGTPYRIGVRDPRGDAQDVLLTLALIDGAVVTSGIYERGFALDGRYYHHILDPKTGYPADSGLRSVTVITQSGTRADALSTAFFVLGLDASLALLETEPFSDCEAIFVTNEGKVVCSDKNMLE